MAKVFITNFQTKRVILAMDGDELRDDSLSNSNSDFSSGLSVVVDNTKTSEQMAVNQFLGAIQELDNILDERGYFDIFTYNQNNKNFQNNAQVTIDKLKKARNLLDDQISVIEELLSDRCGIRKSDGAL